MGVRLTAWQKMQHRLTRNQYSLGGEKAEKKKVNLEWWKSKVNIGDRLAEVVYDFMLDYYGLDRDKRIKKTVHLNTVGSIIAMQDYDAVIWGSGIHCAATINNLVKHQTYVRYDVRAVRGPITEKWMEAAGYPCPHIYGDPAVLMPLVYKPESMEKTYDLSVVMHLSSKEAKDSRYHYIDVSTCDHRHFIDQICKSRLVVSSSLHGIVLAETYGVPAIFWRNGVENEELKFYDWYFSTGRHRVAAIDSLKEIGSVEPMALPNLEGMRMDLIRSFPKDLWR